MLGSNELLEKVRIAEKELDRREARFTVLRRLFGKKPAARAEKGRVAEAKAQLNEAMQAYKVSVSG